MRRTGILHKLRNLIREESLAAMGHELERGGLEGFSTEVGPSGMKEVV
jgi:NitT/TauT family transport system ATP-binding protein